MLAGENGLILFVIIQPMVSAFMAYFYTRRLSCSAIPHMTLNDFAAIWWPMAKLGTVFMLGGLATSVALMIVQRSIVRELGIDSLGFFFAAWGISMQYVGFLLTAMSADYFPRLSEVIQDREIANQLINDQIQIGLAIGGPVLVLLIGVAPWVINLLYTQEFAPAAAVLQWQAVGNVLKLASWPLGFVFLAASRARVFLFIQILWNVTYLMLLSGGLSRFGLEITGIAFLASYVVSFAVTNWLVMRLHGFKWQALSLKLVVWQTVICAGLLALAMTAPIIAAGVAVALAVMSTMIGLRIVLAKVSSDSKMALWLRRVYMAIGWPITPPKKHNFE